MNKLHLFMALVGCRPIGRNTEQHDVFFGIGNEIKDIIPDLFNFWPEAKKKIHLDAWRKVEFVDNFKIEIIIKEQYLNAGDNKAAKLFFINLGGYKPGEFEEFHYKIIIAALDKNSAIKKAKQTAFFTHNGFKNAPTHIDDKYGVDIDDIYDIKDILPLSFKEKYTIKLTDNFSAEQDAIHLGYMKLDTL